MLDGIYRIGRGAVAIIWTIILLVFLLQPETKPIIPTGIPPADPSLGREILFSSLHIVAFTVTTIVWFQALTTPSRLTMALVAAAGIAFVIGLGAEFGQSLVPGRSVQIWDVLANGLGVMMGLRLIRLWDQLPPLAQWIPHQTP